MNRNKFAVPTINTEKNDKVDANISGGETVLFKRSV